MEWYYSDDGNSFDGPWSSDFLRARVADGDVKPCGWIVCTGMREWVHTDCVPGLLSSPAHWHIPALPLSPKMSTSVPRTTMHTPALVAAGVGGAILGYAAKGIIEGSNRGSRSGTVLDAIAIDYNGDDVIDAVLIDVDADGDFDAAAVDLDGDGDIDAVGIDSDGDGDIDAVGIDTDQDGDMDAVGVDTDGDGDLDAFAVDSDNDGDMDGFGSDE